MIVKFFANKGGGSAGASLDYLLGKDRERKGAEVLKGDPELSLAIAESLEFKNNYTVGCLSFAESELSKKTKAEIMDKFEKTLFAGLKEDQYNITWIEHNDKGRVELNFFIPNVEMTTNKRLQPYYDRVDRTLVDTFKKVINHDYNLISPDDKQREQLYKANELRQPKTTKEIKEFLGSEFSKMIADGYITDRQQIIDALTNSGYEISRTTEKSISIKNPDGGRNIRLDGAIYGTEYYKEIATLIERSEKPLGRNEATQTISGEEAERTREIGDGDNIDKVRGGKSENIGEIERVRESYERAIEIKAKNFSNQYSQSKMANTIDSNAYSGVHSINISDLLRSSEVERDQIGNNEPRSNTKSDATRTPDSTESGLDDGRGRELFLHGDRSQEHTSKINENRGERDSHKEIKINKFNDLPKDIQEKIREQDRNLMVSADDLGINSLIFKVKEDKPKSKIMPEYQPILKGMYDEFSERIKRSINRANRTIRAIKRFTESLGKTTESIEARNEELERISRTIGEADKAIDDSEYRIKRSAKYHRETKRSFAERIDGIRERIREIKNTEQEKFKNRETHEKASNLNENKFNEETLADSRNISINESYEPRKDIDDDFDFDR